MTVWPKVSVALATYNGQRFLAPFLDSLVAQTYPSIEVVVADDGSSDETVKLLQSYSDRLAIRFLGSERRGVLGNFERAISGCTTPYVALADQDDVWRADKIERLVGLAKKVEAEKGGGRPVLVYSDLALVAEDLSVIAPSFFEATLKSCDAQSLYDFALDNHVPGCATLANRALLDLALPFPAVSIHDWWLNVMAAAAGSVVSDPESLIDYRQHGGNAIGVGAATVHPLAKVKSAVARPLAFVTKRLKQAKARAGDASRQLVAAEKRLRDKGRADAADAVLKLLQMSTSQQRKVFAGARTGLRGFDTWLTLSYLSRETANLPHCPRDA